MKNVIITILLTKIIYDAPIWVTKPSAILTVLLAVVIGIAVYGIDIFVKGVRHEKKNRKCAASSKRSDLFNSAI